MDLRDLSSVLFEHMPVALVLLDDAGRIQEFNPAFEHMFHPPQGTGADAPAFGQLIEQGALGSFLQDMSSLVKSEISDFETTCRYVKNGDDTGWMRARFIRLFPQQGQAITCALIEDITDHIDETVRLRRDKDLAEQSTRSKSSFLANMSHEIRTPIHTVTGMTELMLDTKLDDEQKEYVKQIRFSAEVLLGIINDILDFSKIEAGKLSLEIIGFDLIKAIEDAVDMQSLEAFRKGIEIVLSLDASIPAGVHGDPIRIRQVLTNLLSNAIKFTGKGEVSVKVRMLREKESVAMIRIEVTDSGIGIPEEKLVHLFQAFSQVDASMTRRFGGTGLGLSICRSLIHMMQGDIGVKSQVGKGSTFWFQVPLPVEHPADDLSSMFDFCTELKVLIVDDNASSRKVCRDALEPFCGRILEAENGGMGLSMLRSAAESGDPFQFALVDVQMPGMDGWQFAGEVNSDKSINAIRMVLMSPPGSMGGEAKMKLLRWFDDYVSKPLKRKEILSVLSRVLTENIDLSAGEGELEMVEDDQSPLSPVLTPIAESVRNYRSETYSKDSVSLVETSTPHIEPQLKILVAEDHFVNQKLFKAILEKLGHVAIVASDGKQAVEVALAEHPDLIFMDVQMPLMNGYEATQALRQADYKNPIVAVTANALKGDQEKCIQAGMNDYLSKPFQRSDVERVIGVWAQKREEKNSLRSAPLTSDAEITAASEGDSFSQNDEIFDAQKALGTFMGDRKILVSVLEDYLRRTPDSIERLRVALKTGSFESGELEAHAIKGSAWNLAAKELGDAANPIEQACKIQDRTTADAHFIKLQAAWLRFVTKATKQISNLK